MSSAGRGLTVLPEVLMPNVLGPLDNVPPHPPISLNTFKITENTDVFFHFPPSSSQWTSTLIPPSLLPGHGKKQGGGGGRADFFPRNTWNPNATQKVRADAMVGGGGDGGADPAAVKRFFFAFRGAGI